MAWLVTQGSRVTAVLLVIAAQAAIREQAIVALVGIQVHLAHRDTPVHLGTPEQTAALATVVSRATLVPQATAEQTATLVHREQAVILELLATAVRLVIAGLGRAASAVIRAHRATVV